MKVNVKKHTMMYPALAVVASAYDENGNAILNLNGSVKTITSSLNDLIKTKTFILCKNGFVTG